MNLFKKASILFILFIFILNNILSVNALYSWTKNKFILSSVELNKTVKWKKYINQINKLFLQIGDNREVLEKLESKTSILNEKLLNDNSSKNKELKNIINYINSKSQINLEKILKYQLEEDSSFNSTISDSDKKIVDSELIKIQLNLFENTNKWLSVLIKDFEKLSNVEEKGDLKMGLNFNQKTFWNLKSNINFSNYLIKASNFNSQINWNLDVNVNSNLIWKGEMNFSLSSFIDFISVDWKYLFIT